MTELISILRKGNQIFTLTKTNEEYNLDVKKYIDILPPYLYRTAHKYIDTETVGGLKIGFMNKLIMFQETEKKIGYIKVVEIDGYQCFLSMGELVHVQERDLKIEYSSIYDLVNIDDSIVEEIESEQRMAILDNALKQDPEECVEERINAASSLDKDISKLSDTINQNN